MSGLKQKEDEIGLADLEKDIKKEEKTQKKDTKLFVRHVKHALIAVIGGSLIYILLGTQLCGLSLVIVCVVAVIEAVLAVLLNDTNLKLHMAVMAVQVVVGIIFGRILFLFFSACFYFLLLIAVKLLQLDNSVR